MTDIEKLAMQLAADLEVKCERCHGKLGECEEGSGRWVACGLCGGSGFTTSEFGERILNLVRHNLRRLLDETDQSG